MTLLSSFGDTALDVTAACQQLAAVAALYHDNRNAVETLLGADGQVIVWNHQPRSWLPSWCLIRSGSARYFLCLAGTTNGWQGARHIDGSFGRVYLGQTNLLVNGQWLGAWEAIETDVMPRIPGGPGVTVYVSGHSYGGAVAQLGAFSLVQRGIYGRVELLTIGGPKALTAGYTGQLPSVYWRLSSWLDLVNTLPLDNLVPGTDHWLLPLVWRQLVADWVHYGQPAYIGPNGGIQSAGKDVTPVPSGVATTPVSEHLLPNYSARLRQNLLNFGGTAAARTALDITDGVLAGEVFPSIPAGLPNVVPGPDGAPVTIPGAVPSAAFPQPFGGAFIMPTWPVPLTGSRMRIALQFETNGGGGWSENFLLVTTDGDPYEIAKQWVAGYAPYRRTILSPNVRLIRARISDELVNRDSFPVVAPNGGLGYGTSTGKSTDPESGWMWTLQDQTRMVNSSNMLRGFPDDLLKSVTTNGNVQAPAGGPVSSYANAVQTLFTANWPSPTGGTGRLAINSVDRNEANWIRARVTAITPGAHCLSALTIDASPGTFNVGDEIYLGVKKRRCLRGISGYYDVVATAVVEGAAVLTICKSICCGVDNFICGLPYVAKKETNPIGVKFATINRQTDRDVGRPFGLSRGRSSARAC